MFKKEKGFTIIELLVVVAIISVLASITISNVTTIRRKAKMARANTEFSQAEKAMKIFAAERGIWPGEDLNSMIFVGTTPYATIGGTPYFVSDYLKLDWSNAAWFCPDCYYLFGAWDEDGDGVDQCAYMAIVNSSWSVYKYKYIRCDDCPDYCGHTGEMGI